MVKFQSRFLIALFIFCSLSVFAQNNFSGIWRFSTPDPEKDPYIVITQISDNDFFVIYVDPFNDHQLDYAEYGLLDDDAYLVIHDDDQIFYLELYQDGLLYQNWNTKLDPNAYSFSRVTSDPFIDPHASELTPENFYKFIQSQDK